MTKLILIKKARNLINTYKINLEYMPRINFESFKTLRDSWYFYESNISL